MVIIYLKQVDMILGQYMNAMVITSQKQFDRYTKTKKKGAQQYYKETHQTTVVETKRRNKEK